MVIVRPHVLAVDDDQVVRTLLKGILSENYDAHVCSSAKEGLEYLAHSEPHTIITDIKMPGKDGFDFLAQIKEMYPNIPVIMITSSSEKETAIKAVKSGAFDFLEKPLNKKELIISVERAVSHRLLSFENELMLRRIRKSAKGLKGFDPMISPSPEKFRSTKEGLNDLLRGTELAIKNLEKYAEDHLRTKSSTPELANEFGDNVQSLYFQITAIIGAWTKS